jgi:hypothetical protein
MLLAKGALAGDTDFHGDLLLPGGLLKMKRGVIPGRREAPDPESRAATECFRSGFRVRSLRSRPGMTVNRHPASN